MKDFAGSKTLKDIYEKYIASMAANYNYGITICFAGAHGLGKTMTSTNILKKACQKNYTTLYTTLADVVNVVIDSPYEEKYLARKELTAVDFLVLDEFDNRFFNNENSSALFGQVLESVFRTRNQNKLPTIMCTNSPNPIESFSGAIKQSIDSLMSTMKLIPVIGEDFRKQQVK